MYLGSKNKSPCVKEIAGASGPVRRAHHHGEDRRVPDAGRYAESPENDPSSDHHGGQRLSL